MSAAAERLIAALADREIQLWLEDGGKLRYRGPKGAMTPELTEQLKAQKDAIVALLAAVQAPVEIPRLPDAPHYALSQAQWRLWVLTQMGSGAAYHVPLHFELAGPLDRAALERTFAALVARHEALRTNFITVDGEPRQVVHAQLALPIAFEDLASEADPVAAARARGREHTARSFDLERDPLIRVTLLRLGPARHVVLFTLHHIIADGTSFGVIVREFSQLYAAFIAGAADPLPPLRVQYRDYAGWQNAQLQGEAMAPHRRYWHEKLGGELPVLELPVDFPRPPTLTPHGGELPFALDRARLDGLRALAQQQQATLFMVLTALVKVLLHRHTGQTDLVVGSPIAGRTHPDLEQQVGFYINTLVLRDRLDPTQSFVEFLRTVRQTTKEAFDHQIYPFDYLVNELPLKRDPSRAPICDVVIVLQNQDERARPIAGVTLQSFIDRSDTAKLDLTFLFKALDDRLQGAIEYNRDLFAPDRIERMAAHFATLVDAVLTNPAEAVGRLNLLPEKERRQVLTEFQGVPAVYPPGRTLVSWFEAQVAKSPDAVALTLPSLGGTGGLSGMGVPPMGSRIEGEPRAEAGNMGGTPMPLKPHGRDARATLAQTFTYAELNARANRLARRLRALGVGPDDLVGMYFERSLEMVVGLLAILKSGGAYLPFDPVYPAERIGFMLGDAQPRVLLTHRGMAAALPAHDATVIDLEACAAELGAESAADLPPVAGPHHAAYAIYTSGSTGRPKGCIVPHYQVVRLFEATQAWFNFGAGDVWTLFHSYAFDFSVWEIWGALLYGGKLVVVPYETSRTPEAFLELLRAERVTVLNQTPSAFRQMIAADEAAPAGAQAPLALREVIFGGEALDIASLKPWWDRHGDVTPRLVNMYGITETTVHVTYRPLSRADLAGGRSVVGRPIPDLQLRLLDRFLQPVPIGVVGEIFVGGAGVARGYLKRPELTAERFVPDPFRTEPGATLYKSGDLARWLPNGDVEYLGRADHQVKIRGFRIELGEIEAAVASQPAVRAALVLVREDAPGEKVIVAYVVWRDGIQPVARRESGGTDHAETSVGPCAHAQGYEAIAALREHVRTRVPDYMVPADFVALAAFPLTPNGKVDRRALPAPDAQARSAGAEYVAPRTPAETAVAAIWAEVLGLPRVGANDNFFELGGHSLKATQVMARLRTQFAGAVSIADLFRRPTVAALAELVASSTSMSSAAAPVAPEIAPMTAEELELLNE